METVNNNKLTQHWNWIVFSSSFSLNPIAIMLCAAMRDDKIRSIIVIVTATQNSQETLRFEQDCHISFLHLFPRFKMQITLEKI